MMTKEQQDAPASPAPPQGEREAFEAWFARRYGRSAQAVRAEAPGSHFVVDRALEAWKAGRASLRASPAVSAAQDEREFADWFKAWALEPGPDSMRAIAEAAWNASRAALSASTQPVDVFWLYELTKGEGVYQGVRGPNAEQIMRQVVSGIDEAGEPFPVYAAPHPEAQALDSQLQQPDADSTRASGVCASTALLPCPFCGGSAVSIHPDEYGSGGQHVPPYHATCDLTQGGCGVSVAGETEEDAVRWWNRRSAAGAQQQDDHAGSPAPSPVAEVKENPYCPEGMSDELTAYLPVGTKLYTHPAPSACRYPRCDCRVNLHTNDAPSAQSSKAALSDEYRFGDGLEQAAFELWAINEGLAYRDSQHGVCFYDVGGKAWAWRAWLARAGITRKPLTLPEIATLLVKVGADPESPGEWHLELARAIEAAHGITPQAGKESGDGTR